MKILIIGGGKPLYFLCRNFTAKGYEVVIINRNPGECLHLARQLSATVICGDGSDPEILKEAGAMGADVVLAISPNDQDNLVICQLASLQFGVPRSVALANDPDNVEVFERLGVTVFSTTHIVAGLIEQRASLEQITNVYADLESGYGADSLYGFLNTPQGVRTWGMESSCMARILDNTEVKASYTYTRTSEEAANTYPYPRHMGKLGLGQYFFGQDLYVNLAAVYHQGKGWSRDQESFLTARNRIQVDGSAAYQLTQNLRVKVLIQNLFKEDVPPAVNYIPREGGLGYAHRFWYLSLDYKF